jgi:hypothetical protein
LSNEQVRGMDMDAHQRGPCEKSYLLDGKLVACPLGCEEQVTFYEQVRHTTLYCVNRLVTCPQQRCGESLPYRSLKPHHAVCPARVLACGDACRDCVRSLRSWINQEKQQGAEGSASCSLVACDEHRSTALMWAVRQGEKEVGLVGHLLDLLFAGGGESNVSRACALEDHVGNTPLTVACAMGQAALVRLMLSKGANVNFETATGARTPLIEACKTGSLEVVKALVLRGARIDYVPRQRKTAVDHADWGGKQVLS